MTERIPDYSPESLRRSLEFGSVVIASSESAAEMFACVVIGLRADSFEGAKILGEDTFSGYDWTPYESVIDIAEEKWDDDRIAIAISQLTACGDGVALGFVSEAQAQINAFKQH